MLPQSSLKAVKSWVQVSPEQPSEAVAPPFDASQLFSSVVLSLPSHSTELSLAEESMVGAVVSSIINVAEVVENNPHSSVAVKVTKAEPVLPQSSLKVVKSLVQVSPEQPSEAIAPPLFINQFAKASLGSDVPSHSTVLSDATKSIVGSVLSAIVKVAMVSVSFPHASVAVNITVSIPVAPQSSLNPVLLFVHVIVSELFK